MMNQELWKTVEDYPNYMVSNIGRVKSLYDNKHKRRDKILSLQKTRCGYLRAVLRKNNKTYHVYVHRIVANAFIPNSHKKPQVNHINGNKQDNRLGNLEWSTQSENMKHAYFFGLEKPCDNGLKKRVSIIRPNEVKVYNSIREMCKTECLDRKSVNKVLSGKKDRYKNLKFKYE